MKLQIIKEDGTKLIKDFNKDDVKAAKKLGWKENKPEVKKKAKKNAKRA